MLTARDLMDEFRLIANGDVWGNTMIWWFAVAGEMYCRGLSIPADWQYRPGLNPKEADAYETDVLEQASDEALHLFGRALNRYAATLKRAGKNY